MFILEASFKSTSQMFQGMFSVNVFVTCLVCKLTTYPHEKKM